ncbi:hypothetical protein [Nocardia fluminea]|uniref:hypothetical protein n=1 Tax=Nocardia fluminea TaxID=134984 RepID=UPI003D0D7ABD
MSDLFSLDSRWLPLGLDVDFALSRGDDEVLQAVLRTYQLQQAESLLNPEERPVVDYAEVTAAQALAANHKLAERLHRQRWYLIRAARAAGDSWSTIGAALGLTKQGAADWFRRNVPTDGPVSVDGADHVGPLP